MGLFKIFVASGVTSSLFTSLLPFIRYSVYDVVGIVRETKDAAKLKHREYLKAKGVKLIDQNTMTITDFFMNRNDSEEWRILWFSTHDDAESLRICSKIAPTLAIGSGAMVDYYTGTIPTSNAYIDGKLRMALTPGVTVLCFGFYLEDDPNVPLTPSGLHRDTTRVLLGIDHDPTFKWDKAYYLTPKTFGCESIIRWMLNPTPKLGKWYHVGTTRAYSRSELSKHLWGYRFNKCEITPADHVYRGFATDFTKDFDMACSDQNIEQALEGVKAWAKLNFTVVKK